MTPALPLAKDPVWVPGIYQLPPPDLIKGLTTSFAGFQSGPDNEAAIQLAERTRYLFQVLYGEVGKIFEGELNG